MSVRWQDVSQTSASAIRLRRSSTRGASAPWVAARMGAARRKAANAGSAWHAYLRIVHTIGHDAAENAPMEALTE